MKTLDLTIVIVNYNSNAVLENCLSSIENNTKDLAYEIIIVDNASKDAIDYFKKNHPDINVIKNSKNMGFSYANNQGIKSSNGKYVLLLNPDTIIINNALKIMVDYMNENSMVGIIGPWVYEKDGKTLQLSCRSFPSFSTAFFNRYSLFSKLLPRNKWTKQYLLTDWDHSHVTEVDWVSGCCMMIRKKMLDQIGLLDTRFFMYNEDVDLCLRANQNNWHVHYLPDAKIEHHIGISSSSVQNKMVIERHKSMWKYYKKHFKKNYLVDIITYAAIWVRASVKVFPGYLRQIF
ncbi:MAG: glycosyltransferase [Candidatus Lokiarchaeota archaeon]|nr:glycosyltransferase [Candidatus Lokiarchaeota archaeon]